jgi:hypothetical protein
MLPRIKRTIVQAVITATLDSSRSIPGGTIGAGMIGKFANATTTDLRASKDYIPELKECRGGSSHPSCS